ncbi:MAG: hypothetical protein R2856_09105 [Caldilineaceae bacterium]
MSRRRNRRNNQSIRGLPRKLVTVLSVLSIIIVAAVLVMSMRPRPEPSAPTAAVLSPEAVAVTSPTPAPKVGYVGGCVRQPDFVSGLGLGDQPLIGTSFRGVTGFAVVNASTGELYQDPTWDDAGTLGAYAYDEFGDFYLGPAPFASLELNPPEKQNIIQRIDSQDGQMTPFLELPSALPPSTANPFGVMGMAYDCETRSLYVSSVAGSNATDEVGRIFRVDLNSGEIVDQIENVDAFGVGVFNGVDGKRLYFAKARVAELFSVGLGADGSFAGDPQQVFATTSLPDGDNRKIRRITFDAQNTMTLTAIDFDFTSPSPARWRIRSIRSIMISAAANGSCAAWRG